MINSIKLVFFVLLFFVSTTFQGFFEARAEIQKYFRWFFSSNENSKICFPDLLTFSLDFWWSVYSSFLHFVLPCTYVRTFSVHNKRKEKLPFGTTYPPPSSHVIIYIKFKNGKINTSHDLFVLFFKFCFYQEICFSSFANLT